MVSSLMGSMREANDGSFGIKLMFAATRLSLSQALNMRHAAHFALACLRSETMLFLFFVHRTDGERCRGVEPSPVRIGS